MHVTIDPLSSQCQTMSKNSSDMAELVIQSRSEENGNSEVRNMTSTLRMK